VLLNSTSATPAANSVSHRPCLDCGTNPTLEHIDDKNNKAYLFLGKIKRNFTYLSMDVFVTLYKSIVR